MKAAPFSVCILRVFGRSSWSFSGCVMLCWGRGLHWFLSILPLFIGHLDNRLNEMSKLKEHIIQFW